MLPVILRCRIGSKEEWATVVPSPTSPNTEARTQGNSTLQWGLEVYPIHNFMSSFGIYRGNLYAIKSIKK